MNSDCRLAKDKIGTRSKPRIGGIRKRSMLKEIRRLEKAGIKTKGQHTSNLPYRGYHLICLKCSHLQRLYSPIEVLEHYIDEHPARTNAETQHMLDNLQIKCYKCNLSFATIASFIFHVKMHMAMSQIKLKCMKCTYVTTDVKDFVNHQSIHKINTDSSK